MRFFCLVADVQMLMPSIVSGGICEILLTLADVLMLMPSILNASPSLCRQTCVGVIIALCMLLLRCPFLVCQCPCP